MGCDIHMTFERQTPDGYVKVDVPDKFDDRRYNFFAWLAGVRGTWGSGPVAAGRGIPTDSTVPREALHADCDLHSHSWVGIDELVTYPYLRSAKVREGETAQDMLGERYFEALEGWRACGVDRIVFWFDN